MLVCTSTCLVFCCRDFATMFSLTAVETFQLMPIVGSEVPFYGSFNAPFDGVDEVFIEVIFESL